MAENVTKQTLQQILNVTFTWYDYSFFTFMLVISASIGIYFGFYKKQESTKDYLLGGQTMMVIPVAMSLVSNNMSGITLLAVPSDIYRFGISYWFCYPSLLVAIFFSYNVIVPVFYKLQMTSTFEYLKLRFDTKTRLLGSVLYTIATILYLSIVIYIPALALAQATGIHIHLISCLVCVVCIFYTTVGGLKAVVYSDSLQFVIMIGSLTMVFFMGLVAADGVENVWTTSYDHGRLGIPLDLDLTKRDTLWSATIGMFGMWSSFMGINQVFIQKCLSLPSKGDVKKGLVIFAIGIFTIGSLCNFTGLVMFTQYSKCDPLASGQIQEPDQLVPLYIMQIAKSVPGLAGLFIAGVFSAALSTLSSSMNGLSGTIYEDFLSRYMSKDISQKRKCSILKCIVAVIGVICTALVLVVEKLGGILALNYSLSGTTSGTILGLFMSGMLIPAINAKGAYYGGILSLSAMSIIVSGSQWHQNQGGTIHPSLPVSTEGCMFANETIFKTSFNISTIDEEYKPFVLFRISHYWYTILGLAIFLTISLIISIFTKDDKNTINKDLLSPVIHKFLPSKYGTPPPAYSSIEKALNVTEINENKDS